MASHSNIMALHSIFSKIPLGAAKLCQDMTTLVNNCQGSDIQFKVGGGISTQENGETIYDESATVTLYAHSVILRCRSPYFVTLLDNDKDWKEKSKCVIYIPKILPSTLQCILQYIYTGDVRVESSDNIIELITTANEMGLEELSTECQNKFINTVKCVFSDQKPAKKHIPVDVALRTHIIPVLNLTSSYSLSNLSKKLFEIILPRMSVIIKSPNAYTTFINEISSEALIKIISSDDLSITEDSVWDLSLSWACHQTELLKTAVEACLNNSNDDEDGGGSSDGVTINDTQLGQLKNVLAPLLPAIRFKLLDPVDYSRIVNILIYMLPRRRLLEINEFFINIDIYRFFDRDEPRKIRPEPKMPTEQDLSNETVYPKITISRPIVKRPQRRNF